MKANPTGRVLLALSLTSMVVVMLAIGQVVPGPVPVPSTYTGIEGRCPFQFGASEASQTTACYLITPGVDYGSGLPPRHVAIGKVLNITDVSVRCNTAQGELYGVYVAYTELEADGYSKYIPLQSMANESTGQLRVGTAPAAMTARAGSQILVRAYQNKGLGWRASDCVMGFSGTLRNY